MSYGNASRYRGDQDLYNQYNQTPYGQFNQPGGKKNPYGQQNNPIDQRITQFNPNQNNANTQSNQQIQRSSNLNPDQQQVKFVIEWLERVNLSDQPRDCWNIGEILLRLPHPILKNLLSSYDNNRELLIACQGSVGQFIFKFCQSTRNTPTAFLFTVKERLQGFLSQSTSNFSSTKIKNWFLNEEQLSLLAKAIAPKLQIFAERLEKEVSLDIDTTTFLKRILATHSREEILEKVQIVGLFDIALLIRDDPILNPNEKQPTVVRKNKKFDYKKYQDDKFIKNSQNNFIIHDGTDFDDVEWEDSDFKPEKSDLRP